MKKSIKNLYQKFHNQNASTFLDGEKARPPSGNMRLQIKLQGQAFRDSLRSLHTYQKMGLKWFTRISEWEEKIDQGISGYG